MTFITYQDYNDWENTHHPSMAEGWAVPPGAPIKILEDETGQEKIIPFDPATLKLSTTVLNWRLDLDETKVV